MLQQNLSQIAGLEKERDFYYQKLRDVETICQEPENENLPHVQKIVEILYTTEVRRRILHFLCYFSLSVARKPNRNFFQGRF